jgi:hypothetical protein
MAFGKPKQTEPEENELWPVVLGHGPKLAYEDGKLSARLSYQRNTYTIGQGVNEASKLVRYKSKITRDSKKSFEQVVMEGRDVIGWLLVDGEGQVLARLASDDEVVYDEAVAKSFAKRAGLGFADWGEVADTRIDALLAAPVADAPAKHLGASRREWLMFVAIAGGFLATWPWGVHITYDSQREKGILMIALGILGFVLGGLGLTAGRLLARLPDKAALAVGLGVAVGFGAAAGFVLLNDCSIWELAPNEVAASLAGLAVTSLITPFWARVTRDK